MRPHRRLFAMLKGDNTSCALRSPCTVYIPAKRQATYESPIGAASRAR
jgi:hypothetical protein